MQKKIVSYGLGGIIVVLVVYLVAFRTSDPSTGEGGPPFGNPGQMPAAVVSTEAVQQGEFAVRAEFVGTLRGIAAAELYAKSQGPVVKLYAETGDYAHAGDILAQVDPAEADQRVRQAEAALKMAEATKAQREATLQVARVNAQRQKALNDKQLTSQQTYDAAQADLLSSEAQLHVAEAQIEQARANLSTAQLQLENTRIRAPFDGVIGKRYLDLGAMAAPNRPVFDFVNLSVIKTTIPIVDKDATYIAAGQPARITSDALPGEVFDGTVARVSPIFDPETGTTEAEIEIPNAQGHLRPGLLVRVSIVYRTEPTALLVPKAALVQSEEGVHVFVAESKVDSMATARRVKVRVIGTSEDASEPFVAVEGTVKRGDRVVTLGQESLRDGAPIRLGEVNPAAASTTRDSVPVGP